MFFRWRRMDEEGRLRAWRLYGWFSGLILCGSCVGAVTWLAWMFRIVNNFKGSVATTEWSQRTQLLGLSIHWLVVFSVTYPIDLLCLSAAKLMILDRMSVFASAPKHWALWGKFLMAAVVAGNVAGLAGNATTAFYLEKGAASYLLASTSYSSNNTEDGKRYFDLSQQRIQYAYTIGSVQSFCEVVVLLLIVFAFVVVGIACARRISFAVIGVERAAQYARSHDMASPLFAQAAAEGRKLRLQVILTSGFVFASLLLRSVYSTMYAVVNQLQDSGKDFSHCSPVLSRRFCDASCYNVFTLMHRWMTRTPEFQLTIVLISSPLTLLVALYGMSNKIISQREQYAALAKSNLHGRT
jgi:hypothetical protein